MTLRLHLRDLSASLVTAWKREFDGVPNVEISRGDIFSTREGPLDANAPIDIRADAIVSPANSFGFMDGGIDAVYTYQFGPQVQESLQELLRREWGGELPVGSAVIVPTGNEIIPWCISAPTMRVPDVVADSVNAYLALRASLHAVAAHNRHSTQRITTILCPGLATAVGRMPVARCARQMRIAWQRFLNPEFPVTVAQVARDDELLRK